MNTQTLKKDLREKLNSGVTQSEISRATGVPQPYISKFANDEKLGITFELACKLLPYLYPDTSLIGKKFEQR